MGRDRDVPATQRSNKKVDFRDDAVCKYALVACCPHQLFVNTKSALGEGWRLHPAAVQLPWRLPPRRARCWLHGARCAPHVQHCLPTPRPRPDRTPACHAADDGCKPGRQTGLGTWRQSRPTHPSMAPPPPPGAARRPLPGHDPRGPPRLGDHQEGLRGGGRLRKRQVGRAGSGRTAPCGALGAQLPTHAQAPARSGDHPTPLPGLQARL